MWQAVKDRFASFTETFEGHCSWMYLDVKGLVTTGRGNLIDPIFTAVNLPWQLCGVPATNAQITKEWLSVKVMQGLKTSGGGLFAKCTYLRLTSADIDALTDSKMLEMEAHLINRFPFWEKIPADAQLGVLSMAWACGPAFSFPKFEAHLKVGNYAGCAIECGMDATNNPGLVPRNVANARLFLNAAQCINAGFDPSNLQY